MVLVKYLKVKAGERINPQDFEVRSWHVLEGEGVSILRGREYKFEAGERYGDVSGFDNFIALSDFVVEQYLFD